ncbi:MAG: protein phosphatase 2C domain-containing protein [Planctomycetes bacterium]|nr:protein phosphatase 2C domain-containing protein [Planctomycetota bacterium]
MCHGKTDVGRRRELNEDSFHCSDRDGLSIVCDGMGGREFGEVASSLAVSTITRLIHKQFPRTLRGRRLAEGGPVADAFVQLFDGWIRDVNANIHSFGTVDPRYREMGTTLALVYHQEDLVVVAHVGDSRVYRVRDGKAEAVTEDHSFVNAQLKAGLITKAEAEQSAHRHIVTRAIGPRGVVKADVAVLPARAGDVFVLCSDGLCDLADGSDIEAKMLETGGDLERGVQALIDLANSRGGPDNITVIMTRLEA